MKKILLIDYPYPDGQARELSLRTMGFDVRMFNVVRSRLWAGGNPAKKAILPLVTALRPIHRFIAAIDRIKLNRELLRLAGEFRPEIILMIKGDAVMGRTLSRLKRIGTPVLLCWDADSMHSPGRPRAVLPKLGLYDMFFTVDSVDLLPAGLRTRMFERNRNIHTVPLAANTLYYHPTPVGEGLAEALSGSVVFIGTINPARKEVLLRMADQNLKIWAPQTSPWGEWLEPGSKLKKTYQQGCVYGEELVQIYSNAAVVIDIHFLFSTPVPVPNVTLRVFEVPAAGGFVLTNFSPQLATLFNVDEEIVTYASADELREKAGFYRTHPAERKRIAEKGRERVLRDHTFGHRLETIFRIANVKR
jgi:spore maturation protein CgeB